MRIVWVRAKKYKALCETGAVCYVLQPGLQLPQTQNGKRSTLLILAAGWRIAAHRRWLAIAHFRCTRDHLLQLAFNIRVAHMPVLKHAIGRAR